MYECYHNSESTAKLGGAGCVTPIELGNGATTAMGQMCALRIVSVENDTVTEQHYDTMDTETCVSELNSTSNASTGCTWSSVNDIREVLCCCTGAFCTTTLNFFNVTRFMLYKDDGEYVSYDDIFNDDLMCPLDDVDTETVSSGWSGGEIAAVAVLGSTTVVLTSATLIMMMHGGKITTYSDTQSLL
jgi:hypothetical protein